MPDISMCLNSSCHLRSDCLRYRSWPKRTGQSYSGFEPHEGGGCDWQIKTDPSDRIRKTEDVDTAIRLTYESREIGAEHEE